MYTVPADDDANAPWPIFRRILADPEMAELSDMLKSDITVAFLMRSGEWREGGRGLLGLCCMSLRNSGTSSAIAPDLATPETSASQHARCSPIAARLMRSRRRLRAFYPFQQNPLRGPLSKKFRESALSMSKPVCIIPDTDGFQMNRSMTKPSRYGFPKLDFDVLRWSHDSCPNALLIAKCIYSVRADDIRATTFTTLAQTSSAVCKRDRPRLAVGCAKNRRCMITRNT